MRNIIFTSVLACVATGVAADGPAVGCFERSYSAAHLAANPVQVVAKLRLLIYKQQGFSESLAALEVQLTDQGHVDGTIMSGQTLDQTLICWTDNGTSICGVECDGGNFEIRRRDKQGMTIRTNFLLIGETDSCGGNVDLAEISGENVSYRVNAVPLSICDGMLRYAD